MRLLLIKVVCWTSFLFIVAVLVVGLPQEIPIVPSTGHSVTEWEEEGDYRHGGWVTRWVGDLDWDKTSWEVRIAHQYVLLLVPVGIVLMSTLYALHQPSIRKNKT